MPTEVPIKFDTDFTTGLIIPKPIGRIYLGHWCLRLILDTDGQIKGYIDSRATEDGSLRLYNVNTNFTGFPDANPSPSSGTP